MRKGRPRLDPEMHLPDSGCIRLSVSLARLGNVASRMVLLSCAYVQGRLAFEWLIGRVLDAPESDFWEMRCEVKLACGGQPSSTDQYFERRRVTKTSLAGEVGLSKVAAIFFLHD